MTQTTHTLGPWRVVSDGISHWIEIEPNKIALIKANKADRDLIAAAPDMLAALEKIVDVMPEHEPHDGRDGCQMNGYLPCNCAYAPAMEQARAAMNKAKGA